MGRRSASTSFIPARGAVKKAPSGLSARSAAEVPQAAGSSPKGIAAPAKLSRNARLLWGAVGLAVAAAFCWSYWTTLVQTVDTWNRIADYSHGFLVLPIAAAFLWMRRKELDLAALEPSHWGWAVLGLALAARHVVALLYIDALDGWTIPIWLAGCALLAGGWPLLKFSGPSLAFLWFMFPLPFAIETSLSLPLQAIATKISTASLQMLGQAAISEGNVIFLGEHTLEVEQACSGLRIFVGIFALAFAYVLFARKTWWENVALLVSALPIALIANATRIVITGLLQQAVSGEAAQHFTHDVSGYVMIPFAALLFWLFLVYLGRLFPEHEVADAGHFARRSGSARIAS